MIYLIFKKDKLNKRQIFLYLNQINNNYLQLIIIPVNHNKFEILKKHNLQKIKHN